MIALIISQNTCTCKPRRNYRILERVEYIPVVVRVVERKYYDIYVY